MSDDGDFLRRWSRRKAASRAGTADPATPPAPAQAAAPPMPAAGRNATTAGVVPQSSETPLPPVETLTPESDFTPFMQAGVDPGVKRAALKTLLRDPRFNVMDGLDVYIDDYSKPDPLPPDWLDQLEQLKSLGHEPEPDVGQAPEDPGQGADAPEKSMQEQAIAFPENTSQPDTSGKDPQSSE